MQAKRHEPVSFDCVSRTRPPFGALDAGWRAPLLLSWGNGRRRRRERRHMQAKHPQGVPVRGGLGVGWV